MIKPRLGLYDLTMIMVSLVIGVGIFRTPQSVAAASGNETVFFAAWIFGGLIAFCGALTFAEIGSRMPVAGGFYKLFSYSYHPAYALMLNWAQVIVNSASTAVVGIIGARYISPLFLSPAQQTETHIRLLVAGIVLVLFVLNYSGVKSSARTQNVLSSLKVMLLLLFSAGMFFTKLHPALPVESAGHSLWQAFGLALVPVFFSYGGYQNTVNYGADVREAKRNLPRGILLGLMMVVLLYLCINVAYVHVLGFGRVQHSELVAADLAGAMFGEAGFRIAALAIFISVLGFINTSLLYNPRVYYAMAEEKTLPPVFKRVNEKTQVQEFALCFFTALIFLSLVVFKSFDDILNYVMFIDTLAMASAAGAIFLFRRKAGKPDPHTGFKIRLFPWIPLVFLLALLYVNASVIASHPRESAIGFTIFLLGAPLYYLMRRLYRSKT